MTVRRAAALSLLGVLACSDDFAVDPVDGFTATVEAESWPAGALLDQALTLRVVVIDSATGEKVAPQDIDWTIQPEGAAEITTETEGLVVIRPLAIGMVRVTATLDDPAFASASVTDSILVRLAGVAATPPSATLQSLGDTLTLEAFGIDSDGDEVRVTGWSWSVSGAGVAAVGALTLESLRVVAIANGAGEVTLTHPLCAGDCSLTIPLTVQQTAASAVAVGGSDQNGLIGALLADSLRIEARDARGVPVPSVPVVWSVAIGGGSLSGSSVTGANGRAAVAWTLGALVGAQQAHATIDGLAPVVFNATGVAGIPSQIVLTPGNATLNFIQDTVHFSAVVRDVFGNVLPAPVTWSSTNEAVAMVGPGGIVSATGNGTASIIAQAGGLADTSAVTVQQVVASITLQRLPSGETVSGDTLSVGDTIRLAATARDSAGTTVAGAPITWSSTEPTVANVDGAGKVTAAARGSATIRAASSGLFSGAAITVASFALAFDGGDVVEIANSAGGPLNLDSAFTIELWVRPRTTTGGALFGLWNEGNKSGSSYALYLRGLVPRAYVRNATGNVVDSVTATSALTPDAWHHVAFVYANGTGTLFVNGALAGTATGMARPQQQPGAPVRIGADQTCTATATCFVGDIDEVRIWRRARSAAELAAEQALRLPTPSAGLAVYYPLYLGAGDPVDIVAGLVGVRGDALGPAAMPAWIIDGSPAP